MLLLWSLVFQFSVGVLRSDGLPRSGIKAFGTKQEGENKNENQRESRVSEVKVMFPLISQIRHVAGLIRHNEGCVLSYEGLAVVPVGDNR